MKNTRRLAVLSLIGGALGTLLIVAFSITGWGALGTAAYQTYELLNRLMATALLLMAAGWLGSWQALAGYGRWAALAALLGTLVFALGTAAEFWLYSDLPYGVPNMRQTAFTVGSMAALVQDIGAMTAGICVWQTGVWPRWAALVLLLALPLDFFAFFVMGTTFLVSVVLALMLGWVLLTKSRNFGIEWREA